MNAREPHHKAPRATRLDGLGESERQRLSRDFDLKESALRAFMREMDWLSPGDDCLSVGQLSRLLDVREKTLRNRCALDTVPSSHRLHGRRRFPIRAVAEWMVLTDFPLGVVMVRWRNERPDTSRDAL